MINKCNILKLFILLGIVLSFSCNAPSSNDCNTAKEMVEKSITAINDRNSKGYVDLIDFDIILEIWKQESEYDSSYQEIVETLQNEKELSINSYSRSYNMLIGTIEKIHKLENWKFTIIESELIETEGGSISTIEKFKVKLKDSFDRKWAIDIYLTKFNDCYYITEPVDPYNFNSDD